MIQSIRELTHLPDPLAIGTERPGQTFLKAAHGLLEGSFARAGWYGGSAEPYASPLVPWPAPVSRRPAVVTAIRRLWLARYNPSDPDFAANDIADDLDFPWWHPELAPTDGWWVDSTKKPASRASILAASVGDLIICQRTGPTRADTLLIGVCAVGWASTWVDHCTDRRERALCLIPLTKFDFPVPRSSARAHHRLLADSFTEKARQLPGTAGPVGRFLSYVEPGDAVDLLSVCGIAPEALAETDTAVLAARLRATPTGNERFLRHRYDAVLQNDLRREHERSAEALATTWAESEGYHLLEGNVHRVPLSGFDLLAYRPSDDHEMQIEVKGYGSPALRSIRLQQAQADRAREAASGVGPTWILFAVLKAGSSDYEVKRLTAEQVVELLDRGDIQVK